MTINSITLTVLSPRISINIQVVFWIIVAVILKEALPFLLKWLQMVVL